jgi:hypothetical protein
MGVKGRLQTGNHRRIDDVGLGPIQAQAQQRAVAIKPDFEGGGRVCFSHIDSIPESVIPAPDQVRGFNIRDPVPRQHWIADRVRNDKARVRNDKARVRNDKARVRIETMSVSGHGCAQPLRLALG